MKELNMSWAEIKSTPNVELQGILKAYQNYSIIHAFDGYSEKDVNTMAKENPSVRTQFADSRRTKERFEMKVGKRKKVTSLRDIL